MNDPALAGQSSQAGDAAAPGSFYELLERVEEFSAKPETTSGTNLKRRLRPAPAADAELGHSLRASSSAAPSPATIDRPPERKPAAPSAPPSDDDPRAGSRPASEAGRAAAGAKPTATRPPGNAEPRNTQSGRDAQSSVESGNEAAESSASEETAASESAPNQSGEVEAAAPQSSDSSVALPEVCLAESEATATKPEPGAAPAQGQAPGQAPPSLLLLTPDPSATAPPPEAALAAAMAAPPPAAPMQPDATAPAAAASEMLHSRMQSAGHGPEVIRPAGDEQPAAEALPLHAFGVAFDLPPEDLRAGMSQGEHEEATATPVAAPSDGEAVAAALAESGIGLVAAGQDSVDSARQSANEQALSSVGHATGAGAERAPVEQFGREHSSPDHEESSRQDSGESRANARAAPPVEAPAQVAAHAMPLQHQAASVAVPAPAGWTAPQTPAAANAPAAAAAGPGVAAALDTDAPVEETRATGPIRIELPREPGAANGPRVGIEIQQQGERVRVDVRTQDTALKGLLRGDLTELLESLGRQGFTARPAGEARHAATGPAEGATLWAPQPAGRPVAETAASQQGQNQSGDSPDLSGRRQRQPDERNNRRGRQRTPGARFELSEV